MTETIKSRAHYSVVFTHMLFLKISKSSSRLKPGHNNIPLFPNYFLSAEYSATPPPLVFFNHTLPFWVRTGCHSSLILIKHTRIVEQWQLQGKETREGDQLPRERWKKKGVEKRGVASGTARTERGVSVIESTERTWKSYADYKSGLLPDGPSPLPV